jgi:hypothetical protein
MGVGEFKNVYKPTMAQQRAYRRLCHELCVGGERLGPNARAEEWTSKDLGLLEPVAGRERGALDH